MAIGALAAASWLTLAAWDASPYDRYLDHGGTGTAAVALFVVAWVLMIVAMMLPTAYPVISLFGGVVGRRDDHRQLLAVCIAGYVAVWTVFGAVAYVADLGLHATVERIAWLDERPRLVAASVLALAGGYQFTPLKYRCLDACRSPRLFVVRRWTGRGAWADAFSLGVDSGLFCLGCCWSLMLVLFAIGAGSIPLMLVLGAAMAVEKNVAWGRRLSTPLGLALVAVAVGVAAGVAGS